MVMRVGRGAVEDDFEGDTLSVQPKNLVKNPGGGVEVFIEVEVDHVGHDSEAFVCADKGPS